MILLNSTYISAIIHFMFLFFLSMTIPNLTVNLSGVFEYGQAYVGKEVDVQFDNTFD